MPSAALPALRLQILLFSMSPTLLPAKKAWLLYWFLGLVVGGIGLAYLTAYLMVRFLFYIFLGRF